MSGAILITGASSGIGLETAVYLAQRGRRVVGTMRDPSKRAELDQAAQSGRVSIDVVALDVTDPAGIDRAVGEVVLRYGAIDALVNNAGIQIRGYFEDMSDPEIRRVFETNVFGAMAVTRGVLPHMRAAKRGRIVFVSSVGGLIGSLGLSAYCSSKFAVEGFAESLALEAALFGVHVSLVEPGIVNTPIWNANLLVAQGAQDPASPNREYFKESERMAAWAVKTSPVRALHVAKAIHHAVTAARPRRRYLVGYRPAAFLLLRRFLPAEMFDRLYSGAVVGKLKKAARPAS